MKKESLILLDTNICIYRTLAYVQPKIYRTELDEVTNKIDSLSNNNFKCNIVISNLVISELKNNSILFWEINNFCFIRLHVRNKYQVLKIFNQAKKSMGKFISKYSISQELEENIKNYPLNLQEIDQFYLKFPQKLQSLTHTKIKNISNPRQKQIKISQRPNDLPEETDRKLLCQAIEIKKLHHSDVYIFSCDGDFTEFVNEIPLEFGINILKLGDTIPSCGED
ncbi:MAG: hypothetical protein WCX73_02830 [Candidatus Pacearchaeota archaeon]|jgi:hypothetical protein